MNSTPNGAYTRTNLGEGSATVYPRFYMESVQDELASAKEGRPIFREEERVEVILAGNPHSRPVFRVNSEHSERWPKEYAAFKAGQEMAVEGTPLEQWPLLNRSQVLELKALGILTVEHTADISDYNLQKIGMGARALRDAAKAYLDDAERIKSLTSAQRENDNLKSEISTLRHQVEELGALLKSTHGQLAAKNDELPAADVALPMASDPVERAKAGQPVEAPAHSSLNALAAPKNKGGRPRKAA